MQTYDDSWEDIAYGRLFLMIIQGSFSRTIVEEISPLDIGTFLGNVGGFWGTWQRGKNDAPESPCSHCPPLPSCLKSISSGQGQPGGFRHWLSRLARTLTRRKSNPIYCIELGVTPVKHRGSRH